MTEDEKYMKAALRRALIAEKHGDAPIGCVIVKDGKIIARAENEREFKKNALCHAELTAISRACKKLGGWRLANCTLYVTLEPCPMCAAAIREARIKRVVFGAYATDSAANRGNRQNAPAPVYEEGILRDDCERLLKSFFKKLR